MNIGIGSIRNISLLLATKTSYSATFFSSQDKKFIPLLCSKNHHPWSLGEHFHKLEASFSFLIEKQKFNFGYYEDKMELSTKKIDIN